MKENLVCGNWITSKKSKKVINPFDGKIIDSVPLLDLKLIRKSILSLKKAENRASIEEYINRNMIVLDFN